MTGQAAGAWELLGSPAHLRWLLGSGAWRPALASALVTPIGMIVVAAAVERRLLRPREQYVSFFWGDLALAVAALAGAGALERGTSVPALFTRGWWPAGCAAGGLLAGLVMWAVDARATTPAGDRVYDRRQLLSPTKIWHNAVCYAPLALVAGTATIPALLVEPSPGRALAVAILKAAAAVLLLFWLAAALWWDPRHAKPAAHVPYRWRRAARR